MADWNKPDLSSYEVDVLDILKNRDLSLARMFKGTTDTNLPVDSIRLDWTGLVGRFGKWNGTTWDTLTLSQDNLPSATSSVKGIVKIATTAEITARTSTDTVVPPSGLSSARVATADKLTVARTIGGVSFDGSANINLPGVNTAGNQNTSGNASTATSATKWTTARTLTIAGKGKSVDGSGDVAWSRSEMGMIGEGQTWVDMSGSRSWGTLYTNSTGRSIQVSISANTLRFTVNGVTFSTGQVDGEASMIIPSGATYSATGNTAIATGRWLELR